MFPQWDDAGTVSPGADPADDPAQLAEEQAGGGRARLQVSGAPSAGPPSGPGARLPRRPPFILLNAKPLDPLCRGYSFFLLSVAS